MIEIQIQKTTDCIIFIQSSRTGKLNNGARSQNIAITLGREEMGNNMSGQASGILEMFPS